VIFSPWIVSSFVTFCLTLNLTRDDDDDDDDVTSHNNILIYIQQDSTLHSLF
jgi:hypothetical protein